LARQVNQVRIIAGRFRGRRLRFVPVPGLRPTPDRVRETLFNWLQGELPGARCLDLFAGTGALGIEALSRGAGSLLAVEHHRAAAARLRENLRELGCGEAVVSGADVLRFLAAPPGHPFDVVFADPPFAQDQLARVCEALDAGAWLSPGAWVYLEQDAARPWPRMPASWALVREGRSGQSAQRLLRCSNMT
jgi:16S rRNA (guanine966-N2)-methyltransferase